MMKILQIAPKPPYPRIDGGCIAMASMIEGLSKDNEVFLAFVSTDKHPFSKSDFPDQFQEKIIAQTKLNTKPNLFKALFSLKSYFISRFYSKQFEKILLKTIENLNPDIIQIESLFMTEYIPALKKTNVKIVLRSHNIESDIWQDRAKNATFWLRPILNFMQKKLLKNEIRAFQSADGIVAISTREVEFATKYAPKTPSILIPLGITQPKSQSTYSDSFFHIGAMDWKPNKHAVNWLISEVWTDVYKETGYPLHLAGKSLDKSKYIDTKGIVNHGEVESAYNFMTQSGILIVPLFSGSGIRIKIIEAGLYAIPLIATHKAVEGLGLVPNEEYIEANTAKDFHLQMCKLAADKALQMKLGANLKSKIVAQYDSTHLNKKLVEFYKSI